MSFVAGCAGQLPGAEWVHNVLYSRGRTIAGGTTEIQRNLVARALFGSSPS
jgi:hypothetical protein